LRVLFVSSEAHPLIKTGGLADVSGSLPAALRKLGVDVHLLIPGYPAVLSKLQNSKPLATISQLPFGKTAQLLLGDMPDRHVPVIAIDCPSLFERAGGPYADASGRDWEDNPLRFGILSKVAAILSCADSPLSNWIPDITHCNDWQSGLAPAYMRFKTQTGTPCARSVCSIHNLAFQGNYPADWVGKLDLPPESFQMHGLEYYGQLSFLKAGIYSADGLTTVSPTYAEEIQTDEFGFGLQGLLAGRGHEIRGILNGIEENEWNPATDPHLAKTYDSEHLADKNENKAALQCALGLAEDAATPLLGVVSRLTHQKGLDMLLAIARNLVDQGCQLAILGSGERELEHGFLQLAQEHPRQVGTTIGYNEPLSHQIMAGADIFIMPSRFESCGLNQMYGLRYGTPPVVSRTGGLVDSVQDSTPEHLDDGSATGFMMTAVDARALQTSIERALTSFRDPQTWLKIQRNGMRSHLGWDRSARAYLDLYRSLDKPR
jgi:starch synthase